MGIGKLRKGCNYGIDCVHNGRWNDVQANQTERSSNMSDVAIGRMQV